MGHPLRRRLPSALRPLWALGLGVLIGGVLLGCGRGTFLGRQYDDLTAYYNGFYNAEQAFEDGLESVNQSSGDVDRMRYLSIFPDPEEGSGGESFEEAIQKSAEILREHPESKWVDDALFLIGRARFYQENYVGATEKFREVIALGGKREGEARFWLSRTLVAADRYEEAAEALRAGLEREADYGLWTAHMRLVRGELLARQEDWAEAEDALSAGLTNNLPDEVGGRAAFLLGQVRETLEKPETAQRAYERVLEFNPPYALEFEARLGAIEMQGLRGQPQQALRRIEELRREDNTNEMRGKIAGVRARLYQAMDRPDRAREALTAVLRGEEAPTGEIEGRLHYDLATLYRDTYEDFTQAAAHFDTAATQLSSSSAGQGASGSGRNARILPQAPTDAAAQSDRFQDLAERTRTVARMDSLLRLGQMPQPEFQAAVEQIRRKRLKQRKEAAERQNRREQQFLGGRQQASARRAQAGPSQQNAVQTQSADAGFLFHRDPTLVQQGRRQFEQRWGQRPLVDNWRRVDAIRSRDEEEGDAEDVVAAGPQSSEEQEPAEQVLDLSAVPRDSASQAEMMADRAVARYELANALFRAAGRPDSAETWFRRVLKEETHSVTRQALYGLAQSHRAQGDTAAAEETYREIIEKYPESPYAERARELLGEKEVESTPEVQTSRADSAYAEAYSVWQERSPQAALRAFMEVAQRYPEARTAPRALLAAGVVYHRSETQGESDSLRARFEQYVASLTQSSPDGEGTANARRDTTGEGGAASNRRSGAEQEASQQSPDTTVSQGAPGRSLDAPRRRPDSSRTASRASADSTTGSGKGLRRPTRVTDTTAAPPAASPSDTTAATGVPDSARAPPSARADTTRRESPSESASTFRVLLTYLIDQHGKTPAATRAQALLEHLEQRATADSTEASAGGGTPSDTAEASATPDDTARSDSSARTARRDSSSRSARPRQQISDTTRSPTDLRRRTLRRDTTASSSSAPDSTRSPRRPVPDTTGDGK